MVGKLRRPTIWAVFCGSVSISGYRNICGSLRPAEALLLWCAASERPQLPDPYKKELRTSIVWWLSYRCPRFCIKIVFHVYQTYLYVMQNYNAPFVEAYLFRSSMRFLNTVKERVPLRHILRTYFVGKYGGTLFTSGEWCVEIKIKVDCSCWHNRYDCYLYCDSHVIGVVIYNVGIWC